jgi:hypothetical protein
MRDSRFLPPFIVCQAFRGLTLLALSSAPASTVIAAEDPRPLRIGADQTGESTLEAAIAAVRLYDRALTAQEIAAIAKGQPGVPPTSSKPTHE